MLARGPIGNAAEEPAYTSGIGRLLYNKWWVDEVYERFILKPIRMIAAGFAWADRVIVDGLVDLSGKMSEALGVLLGRAQTGQTNTYAFVIVLGVLFVLGSFVAF